MENKTLEQTKEFAVEMTSPVWSVRSRILHIDELNNKGYKLRTLAEELDKLGYDLVQPKHSYIVKDIAIDGRHLVIQEKAPRDNCKHCQSDYIVKLPFGTVCGICGRWQTEPDKPTA